MNENRSLLIWTLVCVVAGGWLLFRTFQGEMAVVYVDTQEGQEVIVPATESVVDTVRPSYSRTIGVWVAALCTLFIFSFLYGDNPAYKIAEALLVGVSAAYWMVVSYWEVLIPNLLAPLFPEFTQQTFLPGTQPVRETELPWGHWAWNLVPLVLGIMLLWRLSPKGAWISRWPLAFIIGATAGLRLVGFLQADFLSQIRNSIVPLLVIDEGQLMWMTMFRNLLLVVGILSCLVYFFFSIEHTGVVGGISRVGIWFLMITFGAAFGYTVMGRIALLAIRFEFLFDDWLWLIDPTQKRF